MGQWKAVILIFSVLHLGISQVTEVGDSKSELISNFFVRGPSVQIHSDSEPRSARRLRMSEACLACICLGSTNCQLATGCVSNGQYCGPFLISKPYWLDAGRPVLLGDSPEREGAFEECAMDPICSAQAVRKYMTRFQKDCTGNGRVECEDLALIHLMGPFGSQCGKSMAQTSSFYTKFRGCWDAVLRLSPPVPSLQPPLSASLI